MKLSEGVEWGLHCITVLATVPSPHVLPGKALAEFHGVSESYLLKHLKALTAAGLLEAIPGPKGGYRLARPPGSITLLDVVTVIDGPEPAFRCTEIRRRGPAPSCEVKDYRHPCAIHVAMRDAELRWRQSLGEVTIAKIVGQVAESAAEGSKRKAMAWLAERMR